MWERRADARTKRGKIILTESRVFSSYCRLRKGKSYFIDLACTLHHHVRKCFSYSRFSNPNVFQKNIYINRPTLEMVFFFFFFLWQLENSIMLYIADSMTIIFYLYWGWKLGVELEKAKMCLVLTGGKCIIRNKLSVEFGL